jgi:cell division GTPase FtsZ
MDYEIDQDFENSYEQANMVMVGVGEGGCRAVVTITKDYGMPGLRPVLADKHVALSALRFAKAERIDLDVEWREDYKRCLQGASYAFILVKLGGEHEINAVKKMAEVTSDMNVPFVIFTRMPSKRLIGATEAKAAEDTLESLKGLANASVVIPDDTLFQTISGKLDVKTAYENATKWFAEAVAGVARPFALENVSDTNASRLEWLVKQKNSICTVGFGHGRGPNAVDEAIERLVQSPFLKSAKEAFAVDAALVILSVAPKVSIDQAHQALRQIKGVFDETIHLEPCICVDDSLEEGIRVAALLRLTEAAEPIEQPEAKAEGEDKPSTEPPRKKGRKTKGSDGQMLFVFKEEDLGIFSAKDPTKYFGENLDLPTYSRLNL